MKYLKYPGTKKLQLSYKLSWKHGAATEWNSFEEES